jgi:hypothetical protein
MVVGLAAVAAALAVGTARLVEPDDAGKPAAVRAGAAVGLERRFEAIQDDYLIPQAFVSRQAEMEAELRLQDGYLPPTPAGSGWEELLMIQDGYLPPAENASVATSPEEPASGRFGPR